jgi:predicted XRE-type DNA-binding protein
MRRPTNARRSKRKADAAAHDGVAAGSSNVFADLKVPDPEIALAKAKLVQRIRDLLAERQLTQTAAGELLGLDQPKVSALLRGRVEGYTIDRLFRFLNALGQRVEIRVRPAGQQQSAAHRRSIVVRP